MSENPTSLNQYISQQMLDRSAEPPDPNQDDILYFEQQMGMDFYSMRDNTLVDSQTLASIEQDPTISSTLMDGIEQARNSMRDFGDTIAHDINEMGDKASMIGALKLQYKIMAHSVYVSASTKLAEKTSKGIQTLFKPQ